MKKLISLIRACMTSDMSLFKIKSKKNNSLALPIILSLCFMFAIWTNANIIFERISPMNLQFMVLSLGVILTAIMTIIEGIYKTSSLLFNCKDDQLLLSLPISKRTVLFIRIFKFYVFELLFNSLFIIPIIIAYIQWTKGINLSFILTSIVMIFTLPIIPIVISIIIGTITSSISTKFKYKNIAQILISMLFLLGVLFLSFNTDKIFDYFINNSTTINELISKIYYPAGAFAKLATNFRFLDLLIYLLINIFIFVISLFVLSKFYFKINTSLKSIKTNKKVNINTLTIKTRSQYSSLIKKELTIFFNTPVFIINAGFGLVLFLLAAIIMSVRFDSIVSIFTTGEGAIFSKEVLKGNISIIILLLITATSFLTSITNSQISLEGRNINILKSLPIKTKTILMSKIYSCLVLTTPVLLIGSVVLLIRFKISIIESILLLILSIMIPLVSHFIGLIVNLKYPKLDADNPTEVVKQSMSSFLSLMIGVILLMLTCGIITSLVGKIDSLIIIIASLLFYLLLDIVLYLILINKGSKAFDKLSI